MFVAHSFDVEDQDFEVGGAVIHIRFETFADFGEGDDPAELADLFALHVNAPLNERRTPQRVRDTYLELTTA